MLQGHNHFYSLHSWMGLVTMGMFALQVSYFSVTHKNNPFNQRLIIIPETLVCCQNLISQKSRLNRYLVYSENTKLMSIRRSSKILLPIGCSDIFFTLRQQWAHLCRSILILFLNLALANFFFFSVKNPICASNHFAIPFFTNHNRKYFKYEDWVPEKMYLEQNEINLPYLYFWWENN